MSALRDKLSKAKRDILDLRLTEFNQARFDAALAWVRRSRVGVVLLNITAVEILAAVKLLKKAKSLFGTTLVEDIHQQVSQEMNILPQCQEQPRVLIIAEVTIPQCLHYRVKQKVEQLEMLGCHVQWGDWSDIRALQQACYYVDIVLFYRVPGYPRILELMHHAKALRKLVIYDIDDLIFDRQQLQKKFQQTSKQLGDQDIQGILDGADLYKKAIQHACYGIASTPSLQQAMQPLLIQKKCFVLPNGLDKTISTIRDLPVVKSNDRVTIFYGSGTKTHDEDFASIAEPLTRVMQSNETVHLVLLGHLSLPASLQQFDDRIQHLPLLEFEVFLYCLKHADIAIAPLETGKFADCKSEIKWLEAACFAVPSVVTKTARYNEVIEQGKTGFMADNHEDWFTALSKLVTQASLRSSIGQAAQHFAEKQYGCEAMSVQMKQLLNDVQSLAIDDGLLTSKQNKKRLLIVNVLYPPQAIGGATTVVSQSVKKLSDDHCNEFDVSILTTELDDENPYCLREYEHEGVKVTVIKTPFHAQLETRPKDQHIFSITQKWLSQNRPDLIHFHSIQRLTGSVVEAASSLGINYLVTVHDAWWLSEHQFLLDSNDELVNYQQMNPLNQVKTADDANHAIQRSTYLSKQLHGADAIIAVSDFQANLYRQNGFNNIITVRNGVSIDRQQFKQQQEISPSDKLVIGYMGGFSAHKGFDFLKSIISSESFDHLSFKIIDLFKPHGFSERSRWGESDVEVVGKYSPELTANFYQEIDVLIAPSIWPESFGLVTREAALYGVWVIAAQAGGMAEDVIEGETGFVFPMDDEQSCRQILSMMQNQFAHFKQNKPNQKLSTDIIFSVDQHMQYLLTLYRR